MHIDCLKSKSSYKGIVLKGLRQVQEFLLCIPTSSAFSCALSFVRLWISAMFYEDQTFTLCRMPSVTHMVPSEPFVSLREW